MFRTHSAETVALAFDRDRDTVTRYCRDERPTPLHHHTDERNLRLLHAYHSAERGQRQEVATRFGYANVNSMKFAVRLLERRYGYKPTRSASTARRRSARRRSTPADPPRGHPVSG
ncbi:hypothetical protein [Methylobacterium sp. 285MFTsu5.1]|uniref:hypothetical protein n=1 Tax=Methylobacterium sp. 285MFTsu5.1 TaxID=1172187 RepID=UPI001319F5D6|nr:hypothetical protein [Methylobacterium sp. 285MFTsu5.1]